MEPFVAEIRVFPFNFAPRGWALCNGQLLSIQQNQALYSLLGVTYGGDGLNTFALPNLQGKVAIHRSATIPYGSVGGESQHTLTVNEMPVHTHLALGNAELSTFSRPTDNTWGATNAPLNIYQNSPDAQMSSAAIAASGGSQPHSNMQPYTVLNYCIALQGIFPTRN